LIWIVQTKGEGEKCSPFFKMGGNVMTTRDSMNAFIDQAEDALQYAREQMEIARRQEHYNQTEYSDAQQKLENAYNELDHLMLSANQQQKERLRRMQVQIRQVQNDFVLDAENLEQRSFLE
jgi:flagellar capping protein FliD